MKKYLIVVCIYFLVHNTAFCQEADSVNCFIQLQDLWDLDLNRATIKADFYLNLEYKRPLNKELSILNGSVIRIDTIINSDSIKLLSIRINAELRTHFDFQRFPLDNQKIIIETEPYQYLEQLVIFTNPYQNIILDTIHLNGWLVSNVESYQKINKYSIMESDGLHEYRYSSINYVVPIIRENKTSTFFKTFIPCLISILIIYIGFILHHNQIDLKISLAVGSLFVIISNFIVTQRSLPNVSEFTLIEKINIGSLVIVFLTILFFALSFRFKEKLSNVQWKLVDKLYIGLTTGFFAVMLIVLLLDK